MGMHRTEGGPRRVVVLHSGGKDSTYAAWWAQMRGWEVVAMVSILIDSDDSMMFQTDSSWVSGEQSRSMGLPWVPIISKGEQENEVFDLERGLVDGEQPENVEKWFKDRGLVAPPSVPSIQGGWDALVVGAIRSDYQKTRIERLAHRLEVSIHTPLWHHDSESHMRDLVSHGFDLMLTSVSSDGLGEEWVGRTIDQQSLEELITLSRRHRFHADGEGGEYETVVLYGPCFQYPIGVEGSVEWGGSRGMYRITAAGPAGTEDK